MTDICFFTNVVLFAITITEFKSYRCVCFKFAATCYDFENNKTDINTTLFQKSFFEKQKKKDHFNKQHVTIKYRRSLDFLNFVVVIATFILVSPY